ncbi:MAG: T9SS type A sorting domain-containing protein [Bacteroidia bacterium]|nr:T9SS type A sorting domain-containing protein [Bacteroidia bacterium]
MRKIYTTLCLLWVIATSAFSAPILPPSASFMWALGGGGATGIDEAVDVTTDNMGNIFLMSSFQNTATLNGVTVTGAAKGSGANFDKNLLISKLSPARDNVWKINSNDGVCNPVAMATTANGSLIVTGSVRAILNTVGQTTTANIVDAIGTVSSFSNLGNTSGLVQTVVAKFNNNGLVQWVKEINSSATKDALVEPTALVVDANGDIILIGAFTKTAIFSAATPISISTTNTTLGAFVAKLNGANGDAIYARTTQGGIISEKMTALALDADGFSVYFAGASKNLATPVAVGIGPTLTYTPSISPSLLLVKLDASGTPVYLQSRASLSKDAGNGDIRVKDIVVKDGKVIVGGSFLGNYGGFQFANMTLSSAATDLNGFLAAFNSTDGSDVWEKAIIAPSITEINGLAIGFDGRIWAHGYTHNAFGTTIAAGNCAFGNGVLLADANNKLGDLFLASFVPSNGWAVEAHWAGKGTGSETANALAASGSNMYLASTTNSNPISFEVSGNSYSTLGASDFIFQDYNITSSGIDLVHTNAVSSYYDLGSRSVVVKNVGEYTSVSLFDLTGHKVGTWIASNAGDISFSNLQQGIYLIGATSVNGNRVSVKVAVK